MARHSNGIQIIEAVRNLMFKTFVQTANNGESIIKKTEAVASSGNLAKRPAIRSVKMTTTNIRQRIQKDKNNCLPLSPISFSITNDTERPLLRTEIT